MKVSLIISFYNKISWLKLVLAGLNRQSLMDFEVIIADDGSSREVVNVLQEIIPNYFFPINHVWHKDLGWKKNIILNKAVVASKSDYIIFIDGDCIPHRHFIKDHFSNRVKDHVLVGRRLHLSSSLSLKLTERKVEKGYLENFGMLKLFYGQLHGRKCKHWENGIYAPRFVRPFINRKDKGILGSNFSLYKHNLLSVNGFDERYLAPAVGEDTDLELRLRNIGCKMKSIKHLAIQYHLFHKTLDRPSANLTIFNENKKLNLTYTPFGITR